MKKISLSTVALVVGLGLALTQSAFKPAETTKRWGYIQSTQSFVDITNKVQDNTAHPVSGSYSCLASANICSGDASAMPTGTGQLTNAEAGNFRLNP